MKLIPNKKYEEWWISRGHDPNHPLRPRLQPFFELGADLDFILVLCRFVLTANAMQSNVIKLKERLRARSRRRTKELNGLASRHPGGRLRLTETAGVYTMEVVRWTAVALKNKGLIDPAAHIEISGEEFAWIKQQALTPIAKLEGFPEDWDAAISELGDEGSNLFAAASLHNIPREEAEGLLKALLSYHCRSILANEGTKRRDDFGSRFLLYVTQHLREKTGKPHFKEAFILLRSLQNQTLRRLDEPGKSAKSRVHKFKKQCPRWHDDMKHFEKHFEQIIRTSPALLPTEKVN